VDPLRFFGRAIDVNRVLLALNRENSLTTITGEKGVGKTSLAIRAVRYSAERMNHAGRIYFVSFRDLEEYFSYKREINLTSLCKAINRQFANDLDDSEIRASRGEEKERSEGAAGFVSNFFAELTTLFDDREFATTPLPEGSSTAPNEATRSPSLPGYASMHSSSDELHEGGPENKTLMILDGIDTFLQNKKSPLYSTIVLFLNELFRNQRVSVLATSNMPINLEDLRDSPTANREDKEVPPLPSFSRCHTSTTVLSDVSNKQIPLQSLNQFVAAQVLLGFMKESSRDLLPLEYIHDFNPNNDAINGDARMEEIKAKMMSFMPQDWIMSLSKCQALVQTGYNPLKIKKLAQDLENKKMWELDGRAAPVVEERPTSERSQYEMIESEVRKYIKDKRCASLWVNCIKTFLGMTMNGSARNPPEIKSLEDLRKVIVSWEACEAAIQDCIDRWTKATATHCRRLTTKETRFMKMMMMKLNDSRITNDLITFDNFKAFCVWFSPSLVTLNRVSNEWQCQVPILFHGFMGREGAENELKQKDIGTFLIRLSESR